LQNDDGTMKKPEEIKKIFEGNGINLNAPIISTCGSGVSACVVFAALKSVGHKQTSVYDGSWSEYSASVKWAWEVNNKIY